VVVDHYSRRVLGCGIFERQPSSCQVCQFLGRMIGKLGKAPRHLLTDQGTQFTSAHFKRWCHRRGVRQRFGAVAQYGSIAVVERCIRTLKESLRQLLFIPLRRGHFSREIELIVAWYNGERPHMTLRGATPDEVYLSNVLPTVVRVSNLAPHGRAPRRAPNRACS